MRALVDGRVGRRWPGVNVAGLDEAGWAAYRERLEATARKFA